MNTMDSASSRPRKPKGSSEGGQWVATPKPQEAPAANLKLESSSLWDKWETMPIKMQVHLFNKTRTIKREDRIWGCRSMLSSATYRKMIGPTLEAEPTVAVELASAVAVDMLNEGELLINNEALRLASRSSAHGAFHLWNTYKQKKGSLSEGKKWKMVSGQWKWSSCMAFLRGYRLGMMVLNPKYADRKYLPDLLGALPSSYNYVGGDTPSLFTGNDDALPQKIAQARIPPDDLSYLEYIRQADKKEWDETNSWRAENLLAYLVYLIHDYKTSEGQKESALDALEVLIAHKGSLEDIEKAVTSMLKRAERCLRYGLEYKYEVQVKNTLFSQPGSRTHELALRCAGTITDDNLFEL